MDAVTVWRFCLFVICLASFGILLNRFRMNRSGWNSKTRNYWYALTAWSFTGWTGNLEGVVRHLPLRYTIVFSTAAALVTFFGVLQKGAWGGHDKNYQGGD